jgi:hypothetical protein
VGAHQLHAGGAGGGGHRLAAELAEEVMPEAFFTAMRTW